MHIPLGSKSTLVEKERARTSQQDRDLPHPVYAAMVKEIGAMVGLVLEEFDAQRLRDNTMLVFTSNKGVLYRGCDYRAHADDVVSSLAPLKCEKMALQDVVIRVPLVIECPPVVAANTAFHFLCLLPDPGLPLRRELPDNQTKDVSRLQPWLAIPKAVLHQDGIFRHHPDHHDDRSANANHARD